MKYGFYFFSVCLLFSLCAQSMDKDDWDIFINPKNDIEQRLRIARYYVDKKDGRFDINAEMRCEQNIVTSYLNEIPTEDLTLSPNPLIDYFFSQGVKFSGKYHEGSNRYSQNLFMWTLAGDNKSLSDVLCVSKFCLNAKIKYTDIHKKLFALAGSFTIIGKYKNQGSFSANIPKPLRKMIINYYLAQEEAIVDIMMGLEQPACYLIHGTFKFVTPLHCIEAKYNHDAKEHNIKIFDAQYWKENPLDCIAHVSQDLKMQNNHVLDHQL